MWKVLLGLLPVAVRFIGIILDRAGANEAEKLEVASMIAAAKDDPLVMIKMKDDFKALRAKLKARLEKKPDDQVN